MRDRSQTAKAAFVCWSGGKDSMLSYYKAQCHGFKPTFLLNMMSEDGSRSRTHGLSKELLLAQAEAIGAILIQKRTSWNNYENSFKEVVLGLKEKGVTRGVFGDIDLQGHRDWVERISKDLSIEPILPLWKSNQEDLLNEFIEAGFEAIVVAVKRNLLGEEWLGRKVDKKFISDLKALESIDLCGESGEYHTFVIDGPIFKKRIRILETKKIQRDKHFFLEISRYLLEEKIELDK